MYQESSARPGLWDGAGRISLVAEVVVRNEFTAIFELDDSQEEPRYFAVCPEVIGARAEGKTIDETREKLREAIKAVLAERREKTMRDILFDLPPDATHEIIAVRETISMYPSQPYLGE